MEDRSALISFLAERDAPCPGCMKNLRGQEDDVCPSCNKRLFLGEVRALHDVFGDAKSEPMQRPAQSHAERVVEYLAENNAPCPGCMRNLRGQTWPECPACHKKLYFGELRSLHLAFGDSKTIPMPPPGSPEAERLDLYLEKFEVDCPGCGYKLKGLKGEQCPECGRSLTVAEFLVPEPKATSRLLVNTVTTISVIPLILVSLMNALSLVYAQSVSDVWMSVIYGSMVLGLVYLFVVPGRRLMKANPAWMVFFNPVGSIISLFMTGWVCVLIAWRFFGY